MPGRIRAICPLVVLVALTFGVSSATAGNDLVDLVVSEPPPGYELSTDPAVPNGSYTFEELLTTLGQELQDFERILADVPIHARGWSNRSTGAVLQLYIIQAGSPIEAADFTEGAVGEFNTQGASAFDPRVIGARGFVSETDGLSLHVVAFQQGVYAVQIFSSSADSAEGEAAARDVARRQSDVLHDLVGVTVGDAPEGPVHKSVAVILTSVVGGLMCITAVGVIISGLLKRARAKKEEAEWAQLPQHSKPRPEPPSTPLPPAPPVGGDG